MYQATKINAFLIQNSNKFINLFLFCRILYIYIKQVNKTKKMFLYVILMLKHVKY